ncbi:hypothetical protein Pelo_13378 [Pelomyxa schiedti]|nr:hypothetical protein Pelo_13378 [Pelomyxa schiedti]
MQEEGASKFVHWVLWPHKKLASPHTKYFEPWYNEGFCFAPLYESTTFPQNVPPSSTFPTQCTTIASNSSSILATASTTPTPESPIIDADGSSCCLKQVRNGACGVLGSVQAWIALFKLGFLNLPDVSAGCCSSARLSRPQLYLTSAIFASLLQVARCAKDGGATSVALVIPRPGAPIPHSPMEEELVVRRIPVDNEQLLYSTIIELLPIFQGPAGVVFYLYSLVWTQRDTITEMMATSPPMTSLITCGEALPVLSRAPRERPCIGQLDLDLLQDRLTPQSSLHTHFRHPKFPVWVIHGVAHITCFFCTDETLLRDLEGSCIKRGVDYRCFHYNGMPPSGPLLSHVRFKFEAINEDALSKWDVVQVLSRKQITGTEFFYESVCHASTAEQTAIITSLDGIPDGNKWRCKACSMAIPINWGAWNDKTSSTCKECGGNIADVGRCVWLPFDELPLSQKEFCLSHFSTNSIESLIKGLCLTRTDSLTISYQPKPPFLG